VKKEEKSRGREEEIIEEIRGNLRQMKKSRKRRSSRRKRVEERSGKERRGRG
jgi:hypothetical protein